MVETVIDSTRGASGKASLAASPIRGSLRLAVNAASPQVTAGTDFSIFVVIQNPFELPITVYQVQTHIPVELIDVNGTRLLARLEEHGPDHGPSPAGLNFFRWITRRCRMRHRHTGTAIAVGTDFGPKLERDFISSSIKIEKQGDHSTAAGVMLSFPQNPSSEELDRIFRRLDDYKAGLIPVQLQPGDSVVKQFVLRSRKWLFFTPLTHRFQIQVNYSADGVDHNDTISYEQTIRSGIVAVAVGAAVGAGVGTLLKTLMKVPPTGAGQFQSVFGDTFLAALGVSILASLAVVVAFARKSAAQPIISVEDFWGGALIGFSTSFFGFEQFLQLFPGSNK